MTYFASFPVVNTVCYETRFPHQFYKIDMGNTFDSRAQERKIELTQNEKGLSYNYGIDQDSRPLGRSFRSARIQAGSTSIAFGLPIHSLHAV